jgi:hypothetical protein
MKMASQEGSGAIAPELMELALAGPDWFCRNCESGNKGTSMQCVSCGSSLQEDSAQPEQESPRERSEEWKEKSISTPLVGFQEDTRDAQELSEQTTPFPWWIGGMVILILLVGSGMFWAFSSHTTEATLQKMEWNYVVHIDEWKPEVVRRFRKATREVKMVLPVAGKGGQAGMQLIGNSCREEHYQWRSYSCRGNHCCDPGDQEVCKDVYRSERENYPCTRTVSEQKADGMTCKSLGNGFEKCETRYQIVTREVPDTCTRSKQVFSHRVCECKEDVQEIACEYLQYVWRERTALPTSGEGVETHYAIYEPTSLERIRKEEQYVVTFTYEANGLQTYVETPRSYLEYAAWADRSTYAITLYNMGMVKEIEHPSLSGEP